MSPKRRRATRRGPSTTIHPNGAAEIVFQVESVAATNQDPQPEQPQRTRKTRARRQADVPPMVSEQVEPPAETPVVPGGAVTDSPSNPFFHASTPQRPRSHLPQTPATSSGEVFPTPSSTGCTPLANPAPRSRGTPRVGPHSTASPNRRVVATRQVPKRKKGAADVWPFFTDKADSRICKLCVLQQTVNPKHQVYEFSLKTGTSSLRNHLADSHIAAWVDGCDQLKFPITANSVQPAVAAYRTSKGQAPPASPPVEDIPEYSSAAFLDTFAEFVIAEDLSLNIIESGPLRKIFLMLRNDVDIPHRTTLRNRIEEIWHAHIETLETKFKNAIGKISLTMDLWSDPNLSPFMAVTAHWIETEKVETANGPQYKLHLRSDLIGFHRVPGHHDGEHLSQAFLFIIDRLGIASKIGWVTLDNASNNDTFMMFLEWALAARNIPFDRVKNRIRCFPHIVNLACKAVVSAFSTLDCKRDLSLSTTELAEAAQILTSDRADPITILRTLVRVVRASSLRRQHFSQFARSLGLDLQLLRDVETRWSSTLYMIERALKLEEALNAFLTSKDFEDLRKYRLCEAEWAALAIAREILLVPDAFLQKLSSEKTPTLCNALPCFDAMIRVWTDQQDNWGPKVSTIIQAGIDKLEVYRGRLAAVPAYAIAMVLNPTKKLQFVAEEEQTSVRALLRETLLPYYTTHTGTGSTTRAGQCPPPPPQNERPSQRAVDYTPNRVRRAGGQALRRTVATRTADEILGLTGTRTAPTATSLDNEIAQYLADPQTSTDCLLYWQENQHRFPTLFLAALDYLAIQGSAVPCERVFSSAKETMTDRRNRINEDLMEMLQMLKYSIRGGRSLDFSAGTSRPDIIAHLEHTDTILDSIPDDIDAYVQSLLSQCNVE